MLWDRRENTIWITEACIVKKVLVVDDEQSILTLLQYNLRQAGYEVITAMDGEEGRDLTLSEKPDLVVLDLMLPKMDGVEVCKQLTATAKLYSNFNADRKR